MPVTTFLSLALAVFTIEGPDGIVFRQPQLARDGGKVVMTMGAGDAVFFAASRDGGRTFGKPLQVAREGKLALGRHRGPRIAVTGNGIVISAIVDGNLLSWHSTDGGASWSKAVRINDVANSAREGLHAMASAAGITYSVWLDLRQQGTKLYGAVSKDGGATWQENRLVYESPSGHICECCHPSVKVGEKGEILVMWRNWLDGNRDMYMARSLDGGRTFAAAAKAGSGSWPLNACPMDGGDIAIARDGSAWSAFRRENSIILAAPGGSEQTLAKGKDPAMALIPKGAIVAWTEGGIRVARPPYKESVSLDPSGSYAHMIGGKEAVVAWESPAGIKVAQIAE